MSEHHHPHHHHHHHHGQEGNLWLAFFLNFFFAIIELVGGYFTNSVAIMSDALHDFGDSLALLFSVFAERLSHKDPDQKFTFGYKRFSVLSAFINGIILLTGSLFVIYESISRIFSPQEVIPEGMVGLAILGLAVNGFAAFRLSKNEGLNSKMVMYHLLEDILGWIAVLVVSVVLLFKPWFILDSILSILISFIILKGVYRTLKEVGLIFLQRFPDNLEFEKLKNEILRIEKISDVHAVKGWSLDDNHFYLRFHVQLPGDTTINEVDSIKVKIKSCLKKYKVEDSTIEFESSHSICEID